MSGKIALLRAAILVSALAARADERGDAHEERRDISIIAEIAQRRLDPVALRRVEDLLGGKVSLASIANLADTIAATRPETRNWHFVNIPVGATAYDPDRDCAATPRGDCIVKAIARFRAILSDPRKPKAERAEALVFLVHLVGDIHQPLHCADRNHDGGASTLKVTFFGTPMSLHLVWDVGLIEKVTYDWGDYVDHLERDWLATRDVAQLARGEPVDWAWASHQAAVAVAYALPEDLNLGDGYFQHSRATVDQQLALAGIRLARVLNEALK